MEQWYYASYIDNGFPANQIYRRQKKDLCHIIQHPRSDHNTIKRNTIHVWKKGQNVYRIGHLTKKKKLYMYMKTLHNERGIELDDTMTFCFIFR